MPELLSMFYHPNSKIIQNLKKPPPPVTNHSHNRINRTKQKIHRSLNGWGERIFTVGRLFSFGFEPLDERSGGFFMPSQIQ